MPVPCRTTATARREGAAGPERATVTLVLNPTAEDERYWRTMCRADQVDLKGVGGGEPGETFKTCESAVYGGVFYALRKVEGFYAFLILDLQGEIAEGGADGFALAAAHAVWNGLDYEPKAEDLPELETWTYQGESEVREPKQGELRRPGIPAAPGFETMEDLENPESS